MKKKNTENYLDYIPKPQPCIRLMPGEAEGELNHLDILHTKWADKLAQKFFKKPAATHVELEKFGSFIWPYIDGEHSIYDIARLVAEEFQEEAEPVYERVSHYFRLLKQKGYIVWVK